jgi:cytochrome c oxidase subunit I
MTVTESAPTAAPEAAPVAVETRPGLAGPFGSGDHKVVGRLWIAASLLFLVLAGVAGAVLSIERVDAELPGGVISTDWFAQVFTFHSLAGGFLFLLPLTIGVATLVVPLQVGAPTLAFGRAAAAAFWTFLLGGGILVAAYAIDGGPFGSDSEGVGLFLLALGMVLAAQIVAFVCIAATVLAMRAPGVHLTRTPLFSWSALVAAGVWLLTLPVLLAMVVLLYLDHRYGADGGGGIFLGGSSGIYQRLSWAFGQPALYAFAIPVLGIAAEVVPVFSATRHRLHRVAMGCIGAFGALAIGAWAMPGFAADGLPTRTWLYEGPWIAVSFAAILPVLALLGLWADTARRGSIRLGSPFVYAQAAVLMLLVGLLAGAVQAIEPLETLTDEVISSAGAADSVPLYGTTWTTSVAHYVTLAAVIALFGAISYWASKILGRPLAEGLQKALAGLLLLGTVLLSFPDLVSGLLGQGAGSIGVADNKSTIEILNIVSAVGGGLLVVGALAFALTLVLALARGPVPGDDPWSGHTLEWTTSSPPPGGNFATLPEVTSEAPLYDARHREGAEA